MKKKQFIKQCVWTVFFCFFMSTSGLAATAQYTYDPLNQLVQVQYTVGTTVTTIHYNYDAMGNRTSQVTTVAQTPQSPSQAPGFSGTISTRTANNPVSQNSTSAGGAGPSGTTTVATQELSARLYRITAATPAEAARLGTEFFDFIDQSDLSPEDKDHYKKQATQALEAKTASLKEETGSREAGAVEKSPSSAPAEGNKQPIKKTGKIQQQGEKIYTVTPEPGEAGTADK